MQQQNHETTSEILSQLIRINENHSLKKDDFFYISESKQNKRLEKRVSADVACEILLNNTNLINFRLCTYTKIGYYQNAESLYGPLSQLEMRTIIKRILEKVGEDELLKPYFIQQILTHLKTSRIAVCGPILLKTMSDKQG